QSTEPGSYLNRLRKFFAWRRDQRALRTGGFDLVDAPPGILAFTRETAEERVFCAFNLSPADHAASFDEALLGQPIEGHGFGGAREGNGLRLPPFGAFFGRA